MPSGTDPFRRDRPLSGNGWCVIRHAAVAAPPLISGGSLPVHGAIPWIDTAEDIREAGRAVESWRYTREHV